MNEDVPAANQPTPDGRADTTPHKPSSPTHLYPLLILLGLSLAYWSKVLFTGQVLLPGAFLRGFAPFGADPRAPWTILFWDSLGQYYPWRTFAARQLHEGVIPLWNAHQFAGAPFLANAQSAVFYPLSLPFWVMDTAYAFGVSALLHTLLAAYGTYLLTQRWQLSRGASVVAAVAFAFCGYLSSWVLLPTLANTASWLPLLLWLLERAAAPGNSGRSRFAAIAWFSLALGSALLAGHPQIFIYLCIALLLRAMFLPKPLTGLGVLAVSGLWAALLGAAQLLPTLELVRLGHRGSVDPAATWQRAAEHALNLVEFPSLIVPFWPMRWGSTNENFGYVGVVATLLALAGVVKVLKRRSRAALSLHIGRPELFALVLTVFGLAYAAGSPLTRLIFFTVPGMGQFEGVGRMLVVWSLGVAVLAAFGLDAVRRRLNSDMVPLLAGGILLLELFAAGWSLHPIAPRAMIYPTTQLISWLQEHTRDGSRILFLTPRGGWLPAENFSPDSGRTHPPGVLPPNGAMVYGLHDVNGYDSLSPGAYRGLLIPGEGADVSPPLNGNMILLNNPDSPALDTLNVRYIVSQVPIEVQGGREAFQADGCYVYDISGRRKAALRDGRDLYPGWRDRRYEPESFRFGSFVSLCALLLLGVVVAYVRRGATSRRQ